MTWTTIAQISATGHALAGVASAIVILSLLTAQPDLRRPALASLSLLTTWTLLMVLGLDPSWVPIGAITILTESGTEVVTQQLHAFGAHSGPAFYGLLQALNPQGWPTIRSAVWLNLWATGAGAAVFFGVAWVVLRSPLGGGLMLAVYLCNPLTLNTALSEGPGGLLHLYFFMGLLSVVWLNSVVSIRTVTDCTALVLLLSVTTLAAFTRPATASIGLAALTVFFVRVTFGDQKLSQTSRNLWVQTKALFSKQRRWLTLGLLGLLTLGIHLLGELIPGQGTWLIHGLNPFSPTWLGLPLFLLAVLPLGVVVLFCVGVVHQLRRLWVFAMLPVALIVLSRTWLSAGHFTFYEILRYMGAAVPIIWVIALFGWAPVRRFWTERGWGHGSLTALSVALLAPVWFVYPGYFNPVLVRTNHQRAFQVLLQATEDHPDCGFLTRVSDASHGPHRGSPWRWRGFRGPEHGIWDGPDGLDLDALLARWTAAPQCVLLYRGMDCNLSGQDDCSGWTDDRAIVVEALLDGGQYNYPHERGQNNNPATVGVYVLRQ
jgi:hypothetical protein